MAIKNTVASWFGKNTAPQNQSYEGMPMNQSTGTPQSRRTDTNIAGKYGLFQAPYGPRVPSSVAKKQTQATQSTATAAPATTSSATRTAASSSRRTTASPTASTTAAAATPAAPAEPQLTKEQQLQIDADMMGLTGVARQAFIEEKRGLLPKVAQTKKFSDITQAEKDAGIATSAPVDAGADEVGKDISARMDEVSKEITQGDVTQALSGENVGGFDLPTEDDYKALYDLQRAGNQAEYNSLLEEIKSKFEQARAKQEQINNQATGTVSSFLGRAGAFSSAGGQSMILTQQQANVASMNALAQEEATALANAANAKNQNDLAALESYLQQADKAREERNNLRMQNIELAMTLEDRDTAKQEREQEFASKQASYLGNLTLDQFSQQDPAYIAQVEQQLGMPTGYLKNIAETQDALKTTETEEKAMELSMKLFDLAKELPDGMEYEFSDGTKITGFLQPEGKVMQVTTATGDAAFVTIDPATGEVLKNVQLPGLISEIKAARLFASTGGRSGSRSSSGSSSLGDYDETDKLLLQLASQGIGKTVGELYAKIEGQFGIQLPRAEGFDENATIDQLEALNIISDLSDNIAATPGSAYELLGPPTAFRSMAMDDGTNVTGILNEDTGTLLGIIDPIANSQSEKKSGGFFSNLWNSIWDSPNANVTE